MASLASPALEPFLHCCGGLGSSVLPPHSADEQFVVPRAHMYPAGRLRIGYPHVMSANVNIEGR